MGWLVIIGSIPIVVLGVLFQDVIDTSVRNLWITTAMLAGFGVIMGSSIGMRATSARWSR